ncbi:MAG: hypothetical protein AAF752_00750 [Bacteroidota bacterium]
MFKEVLRSIDAGLLPQIGLVAFLVAFVLMMIYALTLSKRAREYAKRIPLDEGTPAPKQTAQPLEHVNGQADSA